MIRMKSCKIFRMESYGFFKINRIEKAILIEYNFSNSNVVKNRNNCEETEYDTMRGDKEKITESITGSYA